MQKDAWKNDEICNLVFNRKFPHVVHSDHFESISKCLEATSDVKSIIDVGCGNAEFGDVCQSVGSDNVDYTGADLPHMIDKVASVQRSNFNYIRFDVDKDNLSFLNNYDLVFMNAFISEMRNPIKTLGSILDVSKKYVLIHRQNIGENNFLEEYTPYNQDLIATNCTICKDDLYKTIYDKGFKIVEICNSFPNSEKQKTFLMEKINEVVK